MPRVIFRNCYNVISRAVGRVKFDITSGIYAKYHHKSCHYLFIHERFVIFTCIKHFKLMYQSIPAAPTSSPPPSRATAGHLLAFPVPGVGHLQILRCPGTGHLPTPGLFPSFWTARGFLSNYHYTEDYWKKEGHRAVTACSRFYTCISSLLIKIELHRERHPFMFIKLFITCNFTALY